MFPSILLLLFIVIVLQMIFVTTSKYFRDPKPRKVPFWWNDTNVLVKPKNSSFCGPGCEGASDLEVQHCRFGAAVVVQAKLREVQFRDETVVKIQDRKRSWLGIVSEPLQSHSFQLQHFGGDDRDVWSRGCESTCGSWFQVINPRTHGQFLSHQVGTFSQLETKRPLN